MFNDTSNNSQFSPSRSNGTPPSADNNPPSNGLPVDSVFNTSNPSQDTWSTPNANVTQAEPNTRDLRPNTNTYESPVTNEFTPNLQTHRPVDPQTSTHTDLQTQRPNDPSVDRLSEMYDSLTTKKTSPVLDTSDTNSSDMPPGTLPPKKGATGRKLGKFVAGALAVLLLVVGSTAGFYLVRQNQELRQQASTGDDGIRGVLNGSNDCDYSLSVSGNICTGDQYAHVEVTATRNCEGDACNACGSETINYDWGASNNCDECGGDACGVTLDRDGSFTLPAGVKSASGGESCDVNPGPGQCRGCQVDVDAGGGASNGARVYYCAPGTTPTPSPTPTPTPTPTPSPFSCVRVDMVPNSGTLQAGSNRTLNSLVNRQTIRTAYYAVYKSFPPGHPQSGENGQPVCVSAGGTDPDGTTCGSNKQLTFTANVNSPTTSEMSTSYEALAIPDVNGVVNRYISMTAFHTSTDGQFAGSAAACIKNFALAACGGVNPNTVNLSQTSQTVSVRATSVPPEGLESALFGLYRNGQRVCADPSVIANYPELVAGTDFNGCPIVNGVQHRQIMVRTTVTGTHTSKVATGEFRYATMRALLENNVNYNFTAFVTVNGQQVGSQAQCIGSLRVNTVFTQSPVPSPSVSPTPTPRVTPTPTPRVSPTPPTSLPPGPMCLSIRLNAQRTPPQIGDSVNLTCGRVNYPNVSYQFRYRRNADAWINVNAASTGSNISQNFTITASGTFDAQCRLCIGGTNNIQGTCQEWQSPDGPPR